MPNTPISTLEQLWLSTGLPGAALQRMSLSGSDPVLPSSFAVGTAAQTSLAAAALAATEIGFHRNGVRQDVHVDMLEAALECCGRFAIDGRMPDLWDKLAGLYACGPVESPGWLRLHTNFAHHRDGVLRLLGLPEGPDTSREAVAAALQSWTALDFEAAAADAGLVVAALRSFEEWERHPQSAVVASRPLVDIERIGDAQPLSWPDLPRDARTLEGLRVLDLTRILAGPVGGRTLAAYGADVMLVNSPKLPNIEALPDTSRGKLSAFADLTKTSGRNGLAAVLREAHVIIQGYRPGSLARLGFGANDVAKIRPGIVMVSLSAYGDEGPWAGRRGFDSLVQAATGFNFAEAQAQAQAQERARARAAGSAEPKPLPMQILDMASGFLIAFGTQAALLRQQAEGGSWHVRVSLARTGHWLREMGRVANGFDVGKPDFSGSMETSASGFGELTASRHAARFSRTSARYVRPSVKPGTHRLAWP
jgi:crotonobetainyl-CoA:carnitine CoA-transferase CaiB-like acyl-CoA transferase